MGTAEELKDMTSIKWGICSEHSLLPYFWICSLTNAIVIRRKPKTPRFADKNLIVNCQPGKQHLHCLYNIHCNTFNKAQTPLLTNIYLFHDRLLSAWTGVQMLNSNSHISALIKSVVDEHCSQNKWQPSSNKTLTPPDLSICDSSYKMAPTYLLNLLRFTHYLCIFPPTEIVVFMLPGYQNW